MSWNSRSIKPWAMSLMAAVMMLTEAGLVPRVVYAAGPTGLEEIVVTARKRAERLEDTPVSVTAFTGAALERQHINQLDEISRFTPNLVFDRETTFSGSDIAAGVFIRGIGQVDFTLTTEPGVGIYLDGVYIATSIGGVLDLVDVDKVQVLRGPQGTLFGRNTIGGAISITTKKPDDKFHGNIKVTTGAYDRADARGSVNIPITKTLYARLSGATFNHNGFLSAPNTPSGDDLGGVDKKAFRGALRWVPTDRFHADLTADYSRSRDSGVPNIRVGTFNGASLALIGSLADPASPNYEPPPAPLPAPSFIDLYNILATTPIGEQGGIAGLTPGVVPNRYFGMPPIGQADVMDPTNPHSFNPTTLDMKSDSDIWGVALTLSYNLGWATVKSITSYRHMKAGTAYDNAASVPVIGDLVDKFNTEQVSEEFHLSGLAWNGRVKWLIGAYQFSEDGINLDDVEFTPARFLSGAKIDNRSTAGFGQATVDLTDRLSITGGLRYTDENKKFILDNDCHPLPKGPATLFDGTVVTCTPLQTVIDPKFLNSGFLTFVNAPVFPAPGGRVCCLPISDAQGNIVGLVTGLTPGFELLPRGTAERSFDELTSHASIAYHWVRDFMTYFSFSTGFKSGGFVQRVFPPKSEVPTFGPETAQMYEVGFKWIGLDRRLRVNAAGFHTDYDNLQIQVNDGIAPVTRNAGTAEINGFEIEGDALPGTGWRVDASVGYLDAHYTALSAAQNFNTDLREITLHSKLVDAPKWKTHLGVQYTYPVPFGGNLTGRVDWSYSDDVFKDALNFPQLHQPSYHLVDLALTYASPSDTWEVSAFGKNVTDERHILSGQVNGLTQGSAVANIAQPAMWGMSVMYHFGS